VLVVIGRALVHNSAMRIATLLLAAALATPALAEQSATTIKLVIHGGAGTLQPSDFTADEEAAYRERLSAALTTGYEILSAGGSAVDAVEATIRLLEDSPLFNAGKGAVFTAERRNELDASIMDGSALQAGAVAGVTVVRNPISAARAVMEKTPHVLLSGPGADAFASAQALEIVEPGYFSTERRLRALDKAQAREAAAEEAVPAGKHGTVGAVALDRQGRIAAGTSTGGMTNKRHGRIGDSPIIGAGTYANEQCGVSATGHGEYFIRHAVAFDICARLRYNGSSVGEAARQVIHEVLGPIGGTGGVIVLDRQGHHAMEFNTLGMFRGWIDDVSRKPQVEIYE